MRNGNLRKILENNIVFWTSTLLIGALVIFIGIETNKIIFEPEWQEGHNLNAVIVGAIVIRGLIDIRKNIRLNEAGTILKDKSIFINIVLVISILIHRIVSLAKVLINEQKFEKGDKIFVLYAIVVFIIMAIIRRIKLNKYDKQDKNEVKL